MNNLICALLLMVSPSNPPELIGKVVTRYKYSWLHDQCFEYTTRLGPKVIENEHLWIKAVDLLKCVTEYGKTMVDE